MGDILSDPSIFCLAYSCFLRSVSRARRTQDVSRILLPGWRSWWHENDDHLWIRHESCVFRVSEEWSSFVCSTRGLMQLFFACHFFAYAPAKNVDLQRPHTAATALRQLPDGRFAIPRISTLRFDVTVYLKVRRITSHQKYHMVSQDHAPIRLVPSCLPYGGTYGIRCPSSGQTCQCACSLAR
ncbi:hypothetical protein BJ170DRAFT_260586 [Xylariales sp. AK1849]|nr:hypothetical protein BJ170DRAFT_260586 [Xylariales sp. AK1849]